ncbi:MAG: 50S ribosomal protein L10 [Verrucomicrobiota bacterium]
MSSEEKKIRPEKSAIVNEIRGQLEKSLFIILTDYTGMDVVKAGEIREQLRPANAEFHIVKNTMLANATRDLPFDGVGDDLTGPTAMICGDGDVVETAKIIKDFVDNNEIPTIKLGAMDGVVLSADDVNKLASLPSRPQLLGQVVGTIAAPMSGMVGVLNQKLASLVYVLKAVQDKKESA